MPVKCVLLGLTPGTLTWYNADMTTKRLIRISYFAMLTIIGGLISIEIPFAPTVKITFQTLFVAASGLILGGRDGMYAQIVYIVIGLVGVPVFSRGGGITYVLQPSFGYILSFPVQAFLTGFLVSKQKTVTSGKLFLCASAGVLASYAIGITYQVLIVAFYIGNGLLAAIAGIPGVLIMLVKDIILIYLLCLMYPRIMTMIGAAKKQKFEDNGLDGGAVSSDTRTEAAATTDKPSPQQK